MLRLLEDQALKQNLEHAAYELAFSKLSFEQMMDKTIDLYSQLIAKR